MSNKDRGIEGLTRLDVAHDLALTGSLQIGHPNIDPECLATEDDQMVLGEVLNGLRYVLSSHDDPDVPDYAKRMAPDGGWVPRHLEATSYYLPFSPATHIITNAKLAALAWARHLLFETPYGADEDVQIKFERDYDRKVWSGSMTMRTEEGHRNVSLTVRPHTQDEDVWVVSSSWNATDCDGRYSGGQQIEFKEGQHMTTADDPTRDHSAEAAGY
jgi:hypothetical protein